VDSTLRLVLREWKAALTLLLIAVAVIIAENWQSAGPVALEAAKVVRFGSYSNEFGNHPTVIVRLRNGSTEEIRSTPVLLRACSANAIITLVRRAHALQVHPRGCR
jgi:hypothetical protein